jgi:hypothetical protein
MVLIQQQLNTCGFSKAVADVISNSCRSSTLNLYSKRWLSFTKWCADGQITPLEATTPDILEYLDHLRTKVGLVAGTIAGHKTAILMTLERAAGVNLREDIHIKLYTKALMR